MSFPPRLSSGSTRVRNWLVIGALAAIQASSGCNRSRDRPEHLVDHFPPLIDPKAKCPIWLFPTRPPEDCPPVECRCYIWDDPKAVLVIEQVPREGGSAGTLRAGSTESRVVRTNLLNIVGTEHLTRKDMQEIADRYHAAVRDQWPEHREYTLRLPTSEPKEYSRILGEIKRDSRIRMAYAPVPLSYP